MDINKEGKQPGEILDVNQVVNDTVDKLVNVLEDPDRGSTKNLKDIRNSLQTLKSIDKDVPYELFPSTIERLNKIKENLPKLEHEKSQDTFKPEKEKAEVDTNNKSEAKVLNEFDALGTSQKGEANVEDDNLNKVIKTIEYVIEIKEKSSKNDTELEVSNRIINKAVEDILFDVLSTAAKNIVNLGADPEKENKNNQELVINPKDNEKEINDFNSDYQKTNKNTTDKDFDLNSSAKNTENVEEKIDKDVKSNEGIRTKNVEKDKNNNVLNNTSPEQQKLINYILRAAQEETKDPQNIENLRVSLEGYFRNENSLIDNISQEDQKQDSNLENPDKTPKNDSELEKLETTTEKELNNLEEIEATNKGIENIEEDMSDVANNSGEKLSNELTDTEPTSKEKKDIEEITKKEKSLQDIENGNFDSENNKPDGGTPLTNSNGKYDASVPIKESDKGFIEIGTGATEGSPGELPVTGDNTKPVGGTPLYSVVDNEEVYDASIPPIGGESGYNIKVSSAGQSPEQEPDVDSPAGLYQERREEGHIKTPGDASEKNKYIFGEQTKKAVKNEEGDVIEPAEYNTDIPGTGSKGKTTFGAQYKEAVKNEEGEITEPAEYYQDMPEIGTRKASSASDAETAGTVGGFTEDVFGAGSGLLAYPLTGVYENFSGYKDLKRTLNFGESTSGFFDKVKVPDIPEKDKGKQGTGFQSNVSYTEETGAQIEEAFDTVEKNRNYNRGFNYRKQDSPVQNEASGTQEYFNNSISRVIVNSLLEVKKDKQLEYSKLNYQNENSLEDNDITFKNEGNGYTYPNDPSKKITIKKDKIEDRSFETGGVHPPSTGYLKIYRKRALDFEGTVENNGSKVMPFQFEPIYEGDGKKAEYSSISTLGRSAAAKVYTKSNERTMQLTLTYVVTGPARGQEDDDVEGNSVSSKGMKQWSEDYIYGYIIPNFRNLTKPDIRNELAYRLAPPIVQVWYGGLGEFQASTSGAQDNRNSLMDVPSAFLTTWYTARGQFKTYRSLWLVDSVNLEYDGGIINKVSKNKLIAKVNLSLIEIAPSVVANEVLNWWEPISSRG